MVARFYVSKTMGSLKSESSFDRSRDTTMFIRS